MANTSEHFLIRFRDRHGWFAWLFVMAAVGCDAPAASVEQARTPAEQSQLRPGDIVLRASDAEVHSVADLRATIKRQSAGNAISLRIRRGDIEMEFPVPLLVTRPAP